MDIENKNQINLYYKKQNVINLDIDNTFIEEIVVDPRLSFDEYNHIRGTLMCLGVYSNKIRQSDLYRLQQHTIQLL